MAREASRMACGCRPAARCVRARTVQAMAWAVSRVMARPAYSSASSYRPRASCAAASRAKARPLRGESFAARRASAMTRRYDAVCMDAQARPR